MITINPEFEKLIPPLSEEEFKQLESNILKEGIRDALVVWRNVLVDGHNRYKIAIKNDLEFDIIEIDFENEEAAKDWMDANQLGRRNLTPDQRKIIIGRRYLREKKNHGGDRRSEESSDQNEHLKTSERLAKENNVSPVTVRRYAKEAEQFDKIQKENPELATKIWSGEKTLTEAKGVEKTAQIEKRKEEYLAAHKADIIEKPEIHNLGYSEFLVEMPDNSIDLLFTDPPYSTDIDDVYEFAKDWLPLALSKVKENGRAFICIGAYPNELNAYLSILLEQERFIVDNPIIWTYKNTLGITPKMKYNLNYQIILHLYSDISRPLDTSVTNEMFSVQEINAPDGRLGDRFHTWQKPDELAMRLIKHTTKEGDSVLDCFACTGTFLIAASKLGRKSFGCDISAENLEIAKQRGCEIV